MKSLMVPIVIASMAAPSIAPAVELTPQDTHFKAKGRVTLTADDSRKTAECTLIMKGGVNDHGRGKIRSFVLSGRAQECSVVPTGLPWTVKAYGSSAVEIMSFGYQGSVASCRSQAILLGVSDTGQWTANQCLNGVLMTTPPITTVRRHPR